MSRRNCNPPIKARAENLRPAMRGDIVEGMARPALFKQPDGSPVLAVTWPFHDVSILVKVEEMLSAAGYDTLFTERSDKACWELIIGKRLDGVQTASSSFTPSYNKDLS